METINFTIEETGEQVDFAILSTATHGDITYLLVVDETELECDDMTAYVIKAIEQDDEDIIYEIVDDDAELLPVSEKLMDALDDFEIDM
ncbi:DUF1292 domain-containing protein [Vallitalea pronyensis]|uniref:DUF1292 domain-containing protein n=1 Tax=Vallitalea pronyensis TaxID=1348613 RepID=A0A8J8SHX0_9FIRM|nr:DUF1292 domain-containing protein [Vallitalea pronyensis]QUI23863.1 DUF1292 domain-containing protein [Vallitalea pronyensis]